ncbi:MAG: hypothetical protein HY671_02925 [Chloroflexi bacterium]|nr:hypothetical protein [Chloroflexota bacterium]
MTIEFKKETIVTRLLDASRDFQETLSPVETRLDPLTRRRVTVTDTPLRKHKFTRPDVSDLVKRSLEMGCPFCGPNLEKVTPRYPPDIFPEGRLKHREVCVFPNNASFAPFSAVAALGSRHFVEVSEYSQDLVVHGFEACQLFLKRVSEYDRRVKYCTINWNCFPPAGGSIIHPHLQPIADYRPVNRFKELLDASRRYQKKNSTTYWADLLTREKEIGERFIGTTGGINWLVSFAPWSRWWDIVAVFPGPTPVTEMPGQTWHNFAGGLGRVLKFISDQNFYSFNVTLFSAIESTEYFWPHAHVMPRMALPPLGMSDASYIELFHGQIVTSFPPEEVCQQVKQYFQS